MPPHRWVVVITDGVPQPAIEGLGRGGGRWCDRGAVVETVVRDGVTRWHVHR
jgi:hypothetical protein